MDAVTLLENDHRTVEDLFSKAEDAPPSRQREIFAKIKDELDAHAHIEEVLFYPALQKSGNKELSDIVMEGIEEHSQIKKFLREIHALDSNGDEFQAKLKVLMEDTRHHVKEEENEMFPMVRDQLPTEQLEHLGERMQTEKEVFQKARGIKVMTPKPEPSILETAASTVGTLLGKLSNTRQRPKSAKAKPAAKKSTAKKAAAKKVTSKKATAKKTTAKKATAKKAAAKKAVAAVKPKAKSAAKPKTAAKRTAAKSATTAKKKAAATKKTVKAKSTAKKNVAPGRKASAKPKARARRR